MELLPDKIIAKARIIKNVIHGRVKEQLAYLYYKTKKSSSNKRVIIFGQGRTGSTLLESLLSSTGDLVAHGEVLNPRNLYIRSPIKFLTGLSSMNKHGFVCHVKPVHLGVWRKEPINENIFLRTLESNGWVIIYLSRGNVVKQLLSGQYARRSQRYSTLIETNDDFMLKIDCPNFVFRANRHLGRLKNEKKMLNEVNYIEVKYENDLLNSRGHQSVANKVFESLGIKNKKVSTRQHKSHKRDMKDYIENYTEFRLYLEEHHLEHFLENQ